MLDKRITNIELKKIQLDILISVDHFCTENKIRYSLAFGTLLGAVRHGGYIPWDDDIDILMPREDYECFLKAFSTDRYKVLSYPSEPKFVLPYAKVIDTKTILYEYSSMRFPIGVNIDVFPVDVCPSINEEEKWFMRKQFWNNIYTIRKLRLESNRNFIKNIIIIAIQLITFPLSLAWLCNKIQELAKENNNSKNERMAVLATADTKRKWMMPCRVFENYKYIQFENISFQAVSDTDTYLKATYGDYMKLPPQEQQVAHHCFDAFWK